MNTKHNCKVKRIYGKPFAAKISFQENKTRGDIEEELWKSLVSGNKQKTSFKGDLHTENAAILFKIDEKDVTAEQRQIAKRRLYGVSYGMTGTRLEKLLTSKPPSVEEMKRALGFTNLKTEMINLPPELIPHFNFNALKDNLNKIVDLKLSPKGTVELGEQRERYIQVVGRWPRKEDYILLKLTPRFPWPDLSFGPGGFAIVIQV